MSFGQPPNLKCWTLYLDHNYQSEWNQIWPGDSEQGGLVGLCSSPVFASSSTSSGSLFLIQLFRALGERAQFYKLIEWTCENETLYKASPCEFCVMCLKLVFGKVHPNPLTKFCDAFSLPLICWFSLCSVFQPICMESRTVTRRLMSTAMKDLLKPNWR